MEKCQPVQLEPFMHQVSGHSHMFVYDSTTVCKPLCDREYDFYSTLPKKLLQFTAEFKGVIEVDAREDRDGDITLVGLPECLRKLQSKFSDPSCSPGSSGEGGNDSDSDSGSSSACCQRNQQKIRSRKKHGGHEDDHGSTSTLFEVPHGSKVKPLSAGSRNPWSIRCHSIRLDEIRRADKSYKGTKFILLENVVSRYHRPCVLDLKMGTRQYGDDDTDEKRERKNRRCMTTTSAKMGIRMCGMQVYQIHSRKFICRDKYFGRKLTEEGVHEILHQFLHNGVRLRVELIDEILTRLRRLHSVLYKQNNFRFYSSSLLIMYDGTVFDDDSGEEEEEVSPAKRDRGSLGARSSIRVPTTELDRPRSSGTETDEDSQASSGHEERIVDRPCRVDVRMIDFAHTTHPGMQSGTRHNGPDTGYLIGLENLIKMVDELKTQELDTIPASS